MRADEAIKKQLALRLTRLRRRAAGLLAEITMVEQLMADVERRAVDPRLKLRKNSVSRLALQSSIRTFLIRKRAPARANEIFVELLNEFPNLKSSTYRSHLRRMVESGALESRGGRGHYALPERRTAEPEEHIYPKRRSNIVDWSFK